MNGEDEKLPEAAEIKKDDPAVAEFVAAVEREEAGRPAEPEAQLKVYERVKPLMDDGSGFKFHQVTYPEYEVLKQAHADGAEGFEEIEGKLHWHGHLIRPAGG